MQELKGRATIEMTMRYSHHDLLRPSRPRSSDPSEGEAALTIDSSAIRVKDCPGLKPKVGGGLMKRKTTASEKRIASRAAPLRRRVGDLAKAPMVTLGRLVGVGSEGQPWIDIPALGRTGAASRTTIPVGASLIGREVVVSFLDGNADEPVVTGIVRAPSDPTTVSPVSLDASVDGERVLLTGRREVVLRCGKASIALAADGRVVIKGVNLLATSSGLHRIRGGAVQIN